MSTLQAQEPLQWAVLGVVGATTLLALGGSLYTVPWPLGGVKATRNFSVLWRGRAVLSLLSAAWAACQLLRSDVLWGANSYIFSSGVTGWTGSGWMCRIYLTVALGVMQPLSAFTALLMLTAVLSRNHRPEEARHPNARLLGLALLCTLPVAAVQAVIAWLGLAVQYQGQPIESSPRSVLGVFFATYWEGTAAQCGVNVAAGDEGTAGQASAAGAGPSAQGLTLASDPAASDVAAVHAAGSSSGKPGCAACTFPAAAVIAQGVFAVAFLVALWVTSRRLASAVLNTRLKRRVRLFQLAYSLLAALGVVALSVSLIEGPFSWLNAGCWAAYVVTVALTTVLVVWEVVVWPVRELRAVDKRLALWADAAALAAAGSGAPGAQASGPSVGLIKAHNRSTEAESFVMAAAAARTQSVSALGQPEGSRPMRSSMSLSLPTSPYRTSPRRPSMMLQRPLSPAQRQLSMSWQQQQQKLVLASPQREPPPPPWHKSGGQGPAPPLGRLVPAVLPQPAAAFAAAPAGSPARQGPRVPLLPAMDSPERQGALYSQADATPRQASMSQRLLYP